MTDIKVVRNVANNEENLVSLADRMTVKTYKGSAIE